MPQCCGHKAGCFSCWNPLVRLCQRLKQLPAQTPAPSPVPSSPPKRLKKTSPQSGADGYWAEIYTSIERSMGPDWSRLWPIVDLKMWIMREYGDVDFTAIVAYPCEERVLMELSDYRPDHHLRPVKEADSGEWWDCLKYEDYYAWFRRFAAARPFVEKEVNDALEDHLAGFPPDDPHEGGWGVSGYYWHMIGCVVWLGVERWRDRALQLKKECHDLIAMATLSEPTKPAVTAFLIERIAEARCLQSYGMTMRQRRYVQYDDEGPPQFQIRGIHKMLNLTIAKSARICCRPSNVPKDSGQLETLLRALLYYSIPFEPAERVELIRHTIPDDSNVLMKLHHQALDLVWTTLSPDVVAYYLQHQPRVLELNLVPVSASAGRLNTFNVVMDIARTESQPKGRESLEIMLAHGMRFTRALSDGYYGRVFGLVEEDNMVKDVEHLNYLVYWMVQFGMPLGVRLPMQGEYKRLEAHWDMGACTLLEKLIMVTGRFTEYWSPRMVAMNHGDPLEYCARLPQSRRITAIRYLIAEGSPVPAPDVFGRLLNNFALPTLFSALFVLYRAGRKVVLPEFDAELSVYIKPQPVYYRRVAAIVYELILRCSLDPCPESFLDELLRIGEMTRSDHVQKLTVLALRALRRNVCSAFPSCAFPRITFDNYDELASEPSYGEIHLSLTNSVLPPVYAAMFNLADLMDEYKASVTPAGLDELVWL